MASIMTSPKGSGQSIGTSSANALLKNSDFCAIGDLSDEFDIWFGEQRRNHLLEIVLVGASTLAAILSGSPQRSAMRIARSTRFSGEMRPKKAR